MSSSDDSQPECPSRSPDATASARSDARALLALMVLWLLAIGWVGLGGDYPLNDDWAYAISAKEFLRSGRMRILDWAAPSLVAHIAWGALCMRLLGESFVSLRCGTLLFALLGAWATYGLGRSLSLSPRRAILPAIALLFSPWYVNLSFTFMSDVPWLCVVLAALFSFACAQRASREGWASLLLLLTGSGLGVAALIRQFAVVLLPALWLTLCLAWLRSRKDASPASSPRALLRRWAALTLPALLFYGAFHLWYTRVHGPTLANRETWGRILELRGYHQAFHLLAFAFYFSLWLVPLALAVVSHQPSRAGLLRLRAQLPLRAARPTLSVLVAGAALAFCWGLWRYRSLHTPPSETMHLLMPYLGNIVYPLGIGPPLLSVETYAGTGAGLRWSAWLGPVLTLLCLGSAALFSGLFVDSLRRVLRALLAGLRLMMRRQSVDPQAMADPDTGISLFAQSLLILVSGAYLSWHLLTGPFVFDRYLLPVLPLLWILVVGRLPASLLSGSAVFVGLSLWAVVSLIGTRHYLRWNTARAQAVSALRSQGVSVDEIDAGFEYNGTWHFEETLRKTGRLDGGPHLWWVPRIRYALSFSPQQDGCQTVARYPYYTLWPGRFPWHAGAGSEAIHVLRCRDGFEWPTIERSRSEAAQWQRVSEEKQRRCQAEGRRICW